MKELDSITKLFSEGTLQIRSHKNYDRSYISKELEIIPNDSLDGKVPLPNLLSEEDIQELLTILV